MNWKIGLALGATVALALVGFNLLNYRSVGADIFPLERQFDLTYAVEVPAAPEEAKGVRVWIPLAGSREGQKILERRIEAPGPYTITRDPVYANEMIYFEAAPGPRRAFDFKINYTVKVSKREFSPLREEEDLGQYLRPTRYMVVNDEVKRRIREATREGETLREKARAIYDYVIRNMVYDKTTPGWGNGDTLRACLVGKGNCTDFHSLFISMAQAAEIPARFKIGFTIPKEGEGEIPGYHCWAEFYETGKGWRPIDASDAWKYPERREAYFGNFDTNKFLLSLGRDVELSPRSANGPVNIFFYPTVEVDQKEFEDFKTRFTYQSVE